MSKVIHKIEKILYLPHIRVSESRWEDFIVNEKSLEVLKKYDLNIQRVGRGRGGMILSTDEGMRLFLECSHPDGFYFKEDSVTAVLGLSGFTDTDIYIRNEDGEIITEDVDGRKYIVKKWFDAKECDVRNIDELCNTVTRLAVLHKHFNVISDTDMLTIYRRNHMQNVYKNKVEDTVVNVVKAAQVCVDDGEEFELKENKNVPGIENDKKNDKENDKKNDKENIKRDDREVHKKSTLKADYERHMKELKLTTNYLKNKRNRSEFEQLAYKNISAFRQEAQDAVEMMSSDNLVKRFADVENKGELVHGSYNYHNVLFGNGLTAVTNFDRCKNECQISDLYQFMRKILEKYNWNIELAYKLIDEYDKIKPIADDDLELLSALFSFPEKFWKIINHYFNNNKAWIPQKNYDKLSKVIEQNKYRRQFIAQLH